MLNKKKKMSKPKCKKEDWNRWANSQCEFSKSKKDASSIIIDTKWTEMKDWSWGQIDGLKGEDRFISDLPIMIIVQKISGPFQTKIVQKNKIKLSDFTNKLKLLFGNSNGDQTLTEIRTVASPNKKNPFLIVWLFFDS